MGRNHRMHLQGMVRLTAAQWGRLPGPASRAKLPARKDSHAHCDIVHQTLVSTTGKAMLLYNMLQRCMQASCVPNSMDYTYTKQLSMLTGSTMGIWMSHMLDL